MDGFSEDCFMESLHKKDIWIKVIRYVLLLACWLLIAILLAKARDWKVRQDYLQLGPDKIVGEESVIYEEAPNYIYTNPVAMISHCMKVLFLQAGIVLLVATLATVLLWIWKKLSKRRICTGFSSCWSLKSIFTIAVLIVTVALASWRRMELNNIVREDNYFWEIGPYTTLDDFTAKCGNPVIIRRHVSDEDKEWFDNLAHFDAKLWQPEKNLYGFIMKQRPDILLLPWFDDNGQNIVVAWCYLTPKRRELLVDKHLEQNDKKQSTETKQ